MTFREMVYECIREIPAGKVMTYGQVAATVGHRGAARVVGNYMRTNPDAPHTPCHRVVASDGSLTGYSAKGGLDTKRTMLIKEGVRFKGEKVDLTTSLWHATR